MSVHARRAGVLYHRLNGLRAYTAAGLINLASGSARYPVVPAEAHIGDLLIAIVASNPGFSVAGTPYGWTFRGSSSGLVVWTKVCAPGDAGSAVVFPNTIFTSNPGPAGVAIVLDYIHDSFNTIGLGLKPSPSITPSRNGRLVTFQAIDRPTPATPLAASLPGAEIIVPLVTDTSSFGAKFVAAVAEEPWTGGASPTGQRAIAFLPDATGAANVASFSLLI